MKSKLILLSCLILPLAFAKADYTCSANPGAQYSISVNADSSASGGYTAKVNGVTFNDISVIAVGTNGAVDFFSTSTQFNLWISSDKALNGGFQSMVSASADANQQTSQAAITLEGISATCSGSL